MYKYAAMLLVALCFVSPSYADDSSIDGTGNQLSIFCDSKYQDSDRIAWTGCITYIDGVLNGIYVAGAYQWAVDNLKKVKPKPYDPNIYLAFLFNICLPDGVTREQRALVVSKFLKDNPQILQQASAALVTDALANAWPCKK